MSHHGHEDVMERWYAEQAKERSPKVEAELRSAVELIRRIALEPQNEESATCDKWLKEHGYDCEATRRAARIKRADQLDKEIERLMAERSKL